MRVALISDLHGNLIALETVLDELARERPGRVLCLGDVAATGPRPRETVERRRKVGCPAVMGNADAVLLGPIPDPENEGVRRILEIDRWCSEQLSTEHLDFISGFQPTLNASLDLQNDLLCFHGSPRSFDDAIVAATLEEELEGMLLGHEPTVRADGHTREQMLRRHGGTTLVNPGSVGLDPPFTGYALVSSEGVRLGFEFRRLPLPAGQIRRDALESGMPHANWWAGLWEEG